jgi:hypothetical protein
MALNLKREPRLGLFLKKKTPNEALMTEANA